MTVPKWPELVVAGKLFAALTTDKSVFERMTDAETLTIGRGVLRLDTKGGRSFEISVRLVE